MRDTSPLDQFIAQPLAHGRYHRQSTLTPHFAESDPTLPAPSHCKKGREKSGRKSEAGTGEGNDAFYMPLNFRSPYIVALTCGKSAIR